MRDERQRDTGDRQQPDRHADIFQYVEQDHHDDARCHVGIKFIFRVETDTDHLIDEQEIDENEKTPADEAEILADRGEDHIGNADRHVDFGNAEAFAEQFARSDRFHALRQLIGIPGAVTERIEPGIDPGELVILEAEIQEHIAVVDNQVDEQRSDGRDRTEHGQQDFPGYAGKEGHADDDSQEHECRTQVILQDDQQQRRSRPHGYFQQQVHVGLLGPVIDLHIMLGDDPRQHDDEGDFHDLRRLESDATEAEPTFRPLQRIGVAVIENEDQEQQQDACAISDRRDFPELFGIEMHHDGRSDDTDAVPDELHDGRTDAAVRLQDSS